MPLKVMTIVGTRPEIIRLSRTIAELDRHVEHVLVHTGQNFDYELNEIFFEQLGIRKPDHFLEAATCGRAKIVGDEVEISEADGWHWRPHPSTATRRCSASAVVPLSCTIATRR